MNSSSISVHWRPPADGDHNGVIRGFQILYTKVTNEDIPFGDTFVQDIVDGKSLSVCLPVRLFLAYAYKNLFLFLSFCFFLSFSLIIALVPRSLYHSVFLCLSPSLSVSLTLSVSLCLTLFLCLSVLLAVSRFQKNTQCFHPWFNEFPDAY